MAYADSPQQRRAIYIANRLAIILAFCNLAAGVAIQLTRDDTFFSLLVISCSGLYLSTILLNNYGYSTSGRFILTLLLPVSSLVLTVYGKMLQPAVNETSYFSSRAVLLVASILPMILFSFRERKHLITGVVIIFLLLVLYDPIHELFGVGYAQMGLDRTSYGFMHFIILLLFILLSIAFYYYKIMLERAERKVRKTNKRLRSLHSSLEDQHQKIVLQSDELQESQVKLQEAYMVISSQNEMLSSKNVELQRHLEEQNAILESNNVELHKRLDELQQYSYTISHNLRGPIATLLGLSELFNRESATPENLELINHIQTSTQALDEVIRDLTQVLKMQKKGMDKEQVDLPHLLDNALVSLEDAKAACNSNVELDLEVHNIWAVKSYLHSILYNLLSNAFKYCQPDIESKVWVRTRQLPHEILIEVEDNGIGIDLSKHGDSLFKMYRRFSSSRKGRGLGLYLAKMQTESMGGRIIAESTPHVGTTFKIYLPQKEKE